MVAAYATPLASSTAKAVEAGSKIVFLIAPNRLSLVEPKAEPTSRYAT
jgi:hypothetical protein